MVSRRGYRFPKSDRAQVGIRNCLLFARAGVACGVSYGMRQDLLREVVWGEFERRFWRGVRPLQHAGGKQGFLKVEVEGILR